MKLHKSVVIKPDKIQRAFKRFPTNEYGELQNQADPCMMACFLAFIFPSV